MGKSPELYPGTEEIGSGLNEKCGVVGLYVEQPESLGLRAYFGMLRLQHRGLEGSGLVVPLEDEIIAIKGLGLISETFKNGHSPTTFPVSLTIAGHNRYGTVRSDDAEEALGPVEGIGQNGRHFTVSMNGNIVAQPTNMRVYPTDTALLTHNIAQAWTDDLTLPEALKISVPKAEGGFALVVASESMLIGLRDKNGIRPLVLGKLTDRDGYALASETPALDAMGAEFMREVSSGEMVVIDSDGIKSEIIFDEDEVQDKDCVFEKVYFSRPESIIGGRSAQVYRRKMGEILAEEAPANASLVIGVPDSGVPAALGYSRASGIPFDFGLVRDRFQPQRSFIQPDPEGRIDVIRKKLNPDPYVLGEEIVVVDDSIVRGNTSRRIVEILKEAGVQKVHMRISSPEVTNPCYYGIDTPDKDELLANRMTIAEMEEFLGLESLAFLSLEGLARATESTLSNMCHACFTGQYPTPTPNSFRYDRKIVKV
jgi:amidophosphoribosyltransferase